MLRNIIITAIAACALAAAPAKPTRSSLGAEKDSPKAFSGNYWTWPTEWAQVSSVTPTTVWNPVLGRWYGSVAVNGYVNSSKQGDFGADYLHCMQSSAGYAMTCFVAVPPGTYRVDYSCNLASRISIMRYSESGSGYIYTSRKTAYFAANQKGGSIEFDAVAGSIYGINLAPDARNVYDTFTNITIFQAGR